MAERAGYVKLESLLMDLLSRETDLELAQAMRVLLTRLEEEVRRLTPPARAGSPCPCGCDRTPQSA